MIIIKDMIKTISFLKMLLSMASAQSLGRADNFSHANQSKVKPEVKQEDLHPEVIT